MPTCPNGHQSGSDDWCEVCGHRMAGAVPPPPPPPPTAGGGYGFPPPGPGGPGQPGGGRPHLSAVPDPEPELCPQCRTPREGGAPFCEECRWNFLTNTATSYTPAAPRPAQPRFQPPSATYGGGDGYEYQGSRPSQVNRPAEPIPSFGSEPSGPTPFASERRPSGPPPTSGGPAGQQGPGGPGGPAGPSGFGDGRRPGGPPPGVGGIPGQGPGAPGGPGGPGFGGGPGQAPGGPGGPSGPSGFVAGPGQGPGNPSGPSAFGGGQSDPAGPPPFGRGQGDTSGQPPFGRGQSDPAGQQPFGRGQGETSGPPPFGGGQGGPAGPPPFGREPGGPGAPTPPGPPGASGPSVFGADPSRPVPPPPGPTPSGPGAAAGGPPQAFQQAGPPAPPAFPQETGRPPAGGPAFGGGDDDWVISPPTGQPGPSGSAGGPGGGYGYPPAGAHQAPSVPGFPQASRPSAGWTATIGPDREYFMAMMHRSGPEAAGLNLPAYSPEQQRALTGNQVTIGRRRHSTGDTPDIDLSVPPEDPGVSHQHAVLVQQPDGTWAVVDQNSTNGTTVNGGDEPIQPFVPVPLQDGDRVHVGAWTTITVRHG
ncbi:FHA domain-containing protein [Streptomyces sp. NPDC047028]|uniref:FHA domain-containing protein n=1 Tax=Streptomyces sp. NPDC047028 TaxID=3155793 RepID=UPI0033C60A02